MQGHFSLPLSKIPVQMQEMDEIKKTEPVPVISEVLTVLYSPQGCDCMQCGRQVPMFQSNKVLPPSEVSAVMLIKLIQTILVTIIFVSSMKSFFLCFLLPFQY
jgi:hypothetical protein